MTTPAPTNTNPTAQTNLREIVDSKKLSTEEKIALLKERELDLREILVAAEEGMTREEHPDDPGVALRNVHDALEKLGADTTVSAAPTKLGG